ncbi:hypothetical protein F2Q70_00028123 [Brassica cretica]|uniref:Uncharacterized protein n=1 Tax=Brassica cretica TaxID=69181 RepID=A0A3N6PWV6_BRACR|nr:hypothetical protein F2Q70_00028123 [Brassica cretica]KAF3578655.1 hypothetical protein DY000_02034806 [Brassica cretica]
MVKSGSFRGHPVIHQGAGFLITGVNAAVAAAETPSPRAETFPCFGSIEHLTPPLKVE